MKRSQKKDDKLEVRLPQDTKRAFMERCRDEGRPASDALRSLIETYLAKPIAVDTARSYARPVLTLAGVAALVVLVIVPLTPTPSPAAASREAEFHGLDLTRDGVITVDEFLQQRMMKFPESATPDAPRGQFMLSGESNPPVGTVPLTKGEALDFALRVLEGYDRNYDGAVSLDEYEARSRAARMNSFRYFDTNQDRKLTTAEMARSLSLDPKPSPDPKPRIVFPKPTGAQFASRDLNKDGAISEAEFLKADWSLKDGG